MDSDNWDFDDAEGMARFHEAWSTVKIVRSVGYGLFTFGESVLPYFLICEPEKSESTVSVSQGEVRITRPMIITPENMPTELHNFLENQEDEATIGHLLARTAGFRHLRLNNTSGSKQLVSDSVDEVVERISRKLDDEEEDRVAILTCPAGLSGLAVLRYAVERVISSAPENVQELRERGFLP